MYRLAQDMLDFCFEASPEIDNEKRKIDVKKWDKSNYCEIWNYVSGLDNQCSFAQTDNKISCIHTSKYVRN